MNPQVAWTLESLCQGWLGAAPGHRAELAEGLAAAPPVVAVVSACQLGGLLGEVGSCQPAAVDPFAVADPGILRGVCDSRGT